jgi:hypothetical protein
MILLQREIKYKNQRRTVIGYRDSFMSLVDDPDDIFYY